MSSDPPIVNPSVARNNLIVFVLSGIIAALALVVLLAKLTPAVLARIVPRRMQPLSAVLAGHAPFGRVRTVLLAACSVLMLVDAANNIGLWSAVLGSPQTAEYNYFAHSLVRAASVVPAGSLYTAATSQRIAVIVVTDPRWQRRFLRAIYALCVYAFAAQVYSVTKNAVRLHDQDATPRQWQSAYLFDLWVSLSIAVLPVGVFTGSAWALTIAFRRASGSVRVPAPPLTAETGLADIDSLAAGSKPYAMHQRSTVALGPTTVETPTTMAPTTSQYPPAVPVRTIEYPLKRTFKQLTVAQLICWAIFLTFSVYKGPKIMPVRPLAICSLTISCAILCESCFEFLLRWNKFEQDVRAVEGARRDVEATRAMVAEADAAAAAAGGDDASMQQQRRGQPMTWMPGGAPATV
ncbi:hypothetical protein BC828DRAFT_416163 [Blastocladiella britannica]|nr:hypothetical protein BC828DRAFT_416163 [Blastocladiella britannica]